MSVAKFYSIRMSLIRSGLCAMALLLVTNIAAQERKQYTIGLLGDQIGKDYQQQIAELKSNIRAVLGEFATVDFRDILLNNYELEKARINYRQLVEEGVDIVLAFGLVNNMALGERDSFPVPTLALGLANADFINIPENQNYTGINNLNYLVAPVSYYDDLHVFKDLYDYKRLGIVMDKLLMDNIPFEEYFDEYFEDKEAEYSFIPLDETLNLSDRLLEFDAIYVAGGYYLTDDEFRAMATEIMEANLPSFSAFGLEDLERGLMATNQADTYINFYYRRIALNIEAVVKGINPSELPINIDTNRQLSVNFIVANNVDLPLRFSKISTVNFVGNQEEMEFDVRYRLVDIMRGVINENLDLTAERKGLELAEQDVKTAKSNYYPNLNAAASATYTDPKLAEVSVGNNPEFRTLGVAQLDQVVYSESAGAGITISENRLGAQQENYNAFELDQILNGALAYFNALIFKTNVFIQNQNLKTTRKNLEIAQLNFEVGESSKYDELRFRSELASNTIDFLNANRDYVQSIYSLNQLLNNPIEITVDVEDANIGEGIFEGYSYDRLKELIDDPTLRPGLVDFLIEEAKNNAPELKNLNFLNQANERNYRLANGGRFMPTVSLSGQYSYEFNRSGAGSEFNPAFGSIPQGAYNVGLNLSLPIFNQTRNDINKQSAFIQREQIDIFRSNTELAIEKNINDIITDLMNRIANIEISKIAEEAAREALELTQSSYAEGESLLIELVDAQNTFLQAQLASANANYNYLLAAISLERAIGYYFMLNTEAANAEFIQRANQFILERN